jgi:hypothetical protein
MAKISTTVLLSLLALLANGPTASRCAQGFVARSTSTLATSASRPAFVSFRGGEAPVASSSSSLASSSDVEAEKVPSWKSLESELANLRSSQGEEKKPVLTLYR